MTVVSANRRKYVVRMNGRCSKYCKIPIRHGYGILESLGKAGTKSVLGALGKSTGSYGGKQIAKIIQDKTGSQLLGKVAKAALSSVGSFGGERLGKLTGNLLGNTIFNGDKKKEKKPERQSISQLMDIARQKLLGQTQTQPQQEASGINIYH